MVLYVFVRVAQWLGSWLPGRADQHADRVNTAAFSVPRPRPQGTTDAPSPAAKRSRVELISQAQPGVEVPAAEVATPAPEAEPVPENKTTPDPGPEVTPMPGPATPPKPKQGAPFAPLPVQQPEAGATPRLIAPPVPPKPWQLRGESVAPALPRVDAPAVPPKPWQLRGDQVIPAVPRMAPPLPPKPPGLMSRKVSLRPYEGRETGLLVGRQPSVATTAGAERARFAGPSLAHAALRSPHGRVRDRLLVHAFSLRDVDRQGTYLRETLREVVEQVHQFAERTRPEQGAAQEHLRALLPTLQLAMRWDEQLRIAEQHGAVAAEVVAALAQHGRAVLPVSVMRRGVGHALLVCLSREANGDVAAQVYNSGVGIEAHERGPDGSVDGGLRYRASFEVRHIASTSLPLGTWVADILRLAPEGDDDLATALAQLYRGLAARGTVVPAQGGDAKPQQVGNCAWKCVMWYLKAQVDEVSYRSFKVYARSRILNDYMRQLTPVGQEVTLAQVLDAPARALGARGRGLFGLGKVRRRGSAPRFETAASAVDKRAMVRAANVQLHRDVGRLYRALRAERPAGSQVARARQAMLLASDAGGLTPAGTLVAAESFDGARFVAAQRLRSQRTAQVGIGPDFELDVQMEVDVRLAAANA